MHNFWIKIKELRFIGAFIETFLLIVFLGIINHLFFDGEFVTYISMIASAALYVAIRSERRLDNN